jgi:sortase A
MTLNVASKNSPVNWYFCQLIEPLLLGWPKPKAWSSHTAMLGKTKASSFERVLLLLGLVLLAVWGGAWADRIVSSRAALLKFQADESESAQSSLKKVYDPASGSVVDFSLWSPKRIQAFKDTFAEDAVAPVALLSIPKIHLDVPVFNGTDDLTLNRGVGRILGTARIGQRGNLGIAGHRDGFFRGLKDVAPGDFVELVLRGRTVTYVIVHVLQPTPDAALTLVTCYPFYFVGSAPQRYIVSASVKKLNGSTSVVNQPSVKKITSKEE